MSKQQNSLMLYDPTYGNKEPYPSHAGQYRKWHGDRAWLFNPWTGNRRTPENIGSDPTGLLIIPENEPIYLDDSDLYKELLNELGCQGHLGAISEIRGLRESAGLNNYHNDSGLTNATQELADSL